jgi:nucleotide-binding universal stress UspA family protein
MELEHSLETRDKHVLLAVDETESAKRAVMYVADMLGGVPGFRVTVFHLVPEPAEDHFDSDEERAGWVTDRTGRARRLVEGYREILVQAGFQNQKVDTGVSVRFCASVAECLLEEVERLGACTVVLGRRVLSHKEEFLFGSTSNRTLHLARNCAVWVVE